MWSEKLTWNFGLGELKGILKRILQAFLKYIYLKYFLNSSLNNQSSFQMLTSGSLV